MDGEGCELLDCQNTMLSLGDEAMSGRACFGVVARGQLAP